MDAPDAQRPNAPRPDARWHPDADVLATDLGDELVLLHAGSGQMHRLNASARTVWNRLPAGEPELLTALLEAFEVDAETARADLARLLGELEALEMVRPA